MTGISGRRSGAFVVVGVEQGGEEITLLVLRLAQLHGGVAGDAGLGLGQYEGDILE
jgi:hypothetical protein